MKWFIKRDLYEGEILPAARIALITRVDGENNHLARFVVVRFPFRRWKRHIDPRTFMHDEGWCIYRWMLGYSFVRKQWMTCGTWDPITLEEMWGIYGS